MTQTEYTKVVNGAATEPSAFKSREKPQHPSQRCSKRDKGVPPFSSLECSHDKDSIQPASIANSHSSALVANTVSRALQSLQAAELTKNGTFLVFYTSDPTPELDHVASLNSIAATKQRDLQQDGTKTDEQGKDAASCASLHIRRRFSGSRSCAKASRGRFRGTAGQTGVKRAKSGAGAGCCTRKEACARLLIPVHD